MTSTLKLLGKTTGMALIACLLTGVGAAVAQDNSLPPGVVAEQNGVQVTLQDIDAFAARIPEKDRGGFFDSPKRIESTILGLLLKKQLTAQARAEKLDADPAVQRRVDLSTEEVLAAVQLEHYKDTLKQPDFSELAREYYLAHKDEFVETGEVDVKHVLVSTKDRGEDEAKARIGKVEAAARANPDTFDKLVDEYSDDPSKADNHGLIEHAESGNMAPPFATAAVALTKVGQVSPIVKTEFGYHVLKLVRHKPDRQKSFDEIKTALIEKLRGDWVDQQMAQYTGDLRGKPLQASPDLVASLRTRFLAPGTVTPEMAQRAAEEAAAKNKAVNAKQESEKQH